MVRKFTKLKCSIMPYLYNSAVESTERGLPMMRAMVLEYPQDPTCFTLDTQYMLGDSILVAPIFNKEGDVQYYLPEGKWTNYLTGEVLEGNRWYSENHGYMTLPMMIKPNTLLAVGKEDSRPDYDYADGVSLHLFELGDGASAQADIVNTLAEQELSVTASRSGNVIEVKATGAGKPWTLVLRGIGEVASVDQGMAASGEHGAVITPAAGASSVTITLK